MTVPDLSQYTWRTRHVAEASGYTPDTIRHKGRRNEIPGMILVNRQMRFEPTAVKAWIQSLVTVRTPPADADQIPFADLVRAHEERIDVRYRDTFRPDVGKYPTR